MSRELLARLIEDQFGHRVAAACATMAEGAETITRLEPDLVIIAGTLPDGRGFDLVRVAAPQLERTRWLLLPAVLKAHGAREAVRLGVQGVVVKHSGVGALRQAIDKVLAGATFYCPASSALMTSGREIAVAPGRDDARLTTRELEVLHWIAEGKRNAEIAHILGNTAATVKSQVETILRKLHVETRGAAVAAWRRGVPVEAAKPRGELSRASALEPTHREPSAAREERWKKLGTSPVS